MAKTIALLFGLIYTIVGILGFVPSLGGTFAISPPTTLLYYFPVNVLHNIVHLVIGIAGLVMSRTEASGASFCKIFGTLLIIIGLVGFVWPANLDASLLPLRGNDVWLHLGSGVVLLIFGLASKPASATA